MSKTKHIDQRMNQRGISALMVDLLMQLGQRQGDKLSLGRKGVRSAIKQIDTIRKALLDMEKKGGVVLVEQDDSLITVYRLDSYKRPSG